MAAEHVYKLLFFVQSVAFIGFIINYSQKSDFIHTPIKMTGNCKSQRQDVRKAYSDAAATSSSFLNSPRGPLSNCSLADIMNRPGVVMLTTTNLGFLDMTLNMLESIKRAGVCVNTTVVAEDQTCYDYLHKRAQGDPGVIVVKTNSGEMTSKEIMRGDRRKYYALFNKRQEYVLNFLKQGLEVLFTDADTFWFRDPFPYFKGDFDMSMIDPRSPYPLRTPKAHYCAGFAYFKPTNVTIQFIKGWIQAMKDNQQRGKLLADQSVLNGLLHDDKPLHVNVQPLDWNIFPWGPKFYELLAKKANYSTVVMHAAIIRGRAAKVAKFKTSNMWLINTTIEEMTAKV